MDQQFSLSWNNFHGNLTKGFAGLLGNGEFVDVTIAVEGHLLQAHKVILSICSPYFKKMFQLNPCQHPIVVLRDVTHKAMRDLLQFMYHGEVSVKREDLTSFIGTAEVLQIKGLTNKETDEEVFDSDKETSKQKGVPHNESSEAELCASDAYEAAVHDIPESHDLDLRKQKQFLEKLQRLSSLKRKSEEYLQKKYYSDILTSEKRPKVVEKVSYNKSSNHLLQNENMESVRNIYEENAVEITTSLNPSIHNMHHEKELPDSGKNLSLTENTIELKTECDDSDIIVADPAVCTTPKSFDSSRDGKPSFIPMEYQSPQENALSLVRAANSGEGLPPRYRYIYSRKGHKQLVLRNFVYTKHSTAHGKTSWRCVQYFSLNRCPATVETVRAAVLAAHHAHNHPDCHDKLLKSKVFEMDDAPDVKYH